MKKWDNQQALQIIRNSADSGQVLTHGIRQLVDCFGYVDETAIAPLAKYFLRSKAEVYGVIQYYSDFRTRAPGRHVLRICQAESCQATGSRKLTEHICDKTGITLGQTSKNQRLTLEPVYCLGLCANGPAAELDGQPLAGLNKTKINALLDRLQS